MLLVAGRETWKQQKQNEKKTNEHRIRLKVDCHPVRGCFTSFTPYIFKLDSKSILCSVVSVCVCVFVLNQTNEALL